MRRTLVVVLIGVVALTGGVIIGFKLDSDESAAPVPTGLPATGERPLEILAASLKMPYTLLHGYYVWPWAYAVESSDDLSLHEVELLAPLGPPGRFFPEGTGYLGWRAGIAPDGTWAFYVAGD